MQSVQLIERLVDLVDPRRNIFLNMSAEEALSRVASGDPQQVRGIDGQFALVHKAGKIIRMARSIGRPLRYFIAKKHAGPVLIVAERIDEIWNWLKAEGLDNQFHPSYTRMVPAHHLTELALVGCPDPSPTYSRFFDPQRNRLSTNLDEIGRAYIGALADELNKWLDYVAKTDAAERPGQSPQPIGVLFSGGIDSGSVLLTLYHLLLSRGEAPQRLKAFTLDVGGNGADAQQASQFLSALDLEYLLERIEVPIESISVDAAIRTVEDYKPLDVESATMTLALCQGIRDRYPDWKWLVDGDGGDENLKDYPIHENTELTIRSVLNNQMLYQEGWGVHAIKHSLTYSGGQSRGHVRSSAPVAALGFHGFSPFALPNVIEVAEGIPFIELTDWDESRLYALKGEIVRRGVEAVTGLSMPTFEKRRFQRGATDEKSYQTIFPADPNEYRRRFLRQFV
ncbi:MULTISPECIES: asparagine synthase-related protein [unclassified Schlesneria]|uniref:asparagine synthase-related protein n=1 Tax=unclassified Schlesneria TaxID=2762017 RepID=UPI002F159880